MVYVERDCVIEHEGKRFELGGAIVTPERVFAYLARKNGRLVVTDWHGNILTDSVQIISERPHRGWLSDKRIYIRFEIDGVMYSGVAFGEGIYLRAKRIKERAKCA